jgi:hypothetical protein
MRTLCLLGLAAKREQYEWESFWTTLTFGVP